MTAPQGPMPAQCRSVWGDFERDHYDQARQRIRQRKSAVNRLAHWLATDAGGNIVSPEDVTKTDLKRYISASAEANRRTTPPLPGGRPPVCGQVRAAAVP
jgi:hypothetical protein